MFENSIIVYQIFNNIIKANHCSLVEYTTAYGTKKRAVIVNEVNKIIYIFNKNPYLVHNLNILEDQILEDLNEKLATLVNGETFELMGDYKLSNSEFIINIPYHIRIEVSRSRKRKIPHFSAPYNGVLENLPTPIFTVINETTKQQRMEILQHEIVEFNNKDFVLYDANLITEFGIQVLREKKESYKETYEEMMKNYYLEKELKINKKKSRKQIIELCGKAKTLKQLTLDDKVKILQKELQRELTAYELTTVQILTKRQLRKRRLKEQRKFDKLERALSYLNKDLKEASKEISTLSSNYHIKDISSPSINSINNMPRIQSPIEKEDILLDDLDKIPNILPHTTDDEISIHNNSISNKGSLEPEKKQRTFVATSRNLSIVKYLKNLYKDQCQVCGETIEISPDNFLSEVHHLKPLGAHNGPDVTENMIVLCPNHHAMFDRGAITIDIEKKIVIHFNPDNPLNHKSIELKHEIDSSYIAYHNTNIFINSDDFQNQEDMIINKDKTDTPIQTIDFGNIVTLQDIHTNELFEVKLEDRFNKDFMKPIEKVILHKCLNDIVQFDTFRYQIIDICTD